MSLRKACSVLGVSRSQMYYQRICSSEKDMSDATLMNKIQDIYQMCPFQGYKRITHDLNDCGYGVPHKHVYRWMQLMRLQTMDPRKNLIKRRLADSVYPHFLKQYLPQKVHDFWCVDITYIKTIRGRYRLV
jgi:putative transposase